MRPRKHILAGAASLVLLASLDTAHAGFSVLYAFSGGSDGAYPAAGLITDSAGNLYGTTQYGGNTACSGQGCGTVFELASDGTETVLYAFAGGSHGALPLAAVVRDSAGNLYGTTQEGGNNGCVEAGCGTVFELSPDGTENVLYAFTGGSDGDDIFAGLVRDSAGNLYGAASAGGTGCGGLGCGTIFKLTPHGTFKVVYAFTGGNDGASPVSNLIRDTSGNLYGTTVAGGSTACAEGCGTVFKVAPNDRETVLYAFTAGTDGHSPEAGLIEDKAGDFYGTTQKGGSTGCLDAGCGTIFKLTPKGAETLLYTFIGENDGFWPVAGLTRDSSDNLYGTAMFGGKCRDYGCGVVFELTPDGTETVLHFLAGKSGKWPLAGLLKDSAGNLYGTAEYDGAYNRGTVFKISK